MSEFDNSPSIKAAVEAAKAKGEQPEATPEAPAEFADTQPATDAQPGTTTGNAPLEDDHTNTSQTEG